MYVNMGPGGTNHLYVTPSIPLNENVYFDYINMLPGPIIFSELNIHHYAVHVQAQTLFLFP